MSNRKKWALGVTAAGISAVLAAAAAGAWNAESPHYWRRHAQALLLRTAEALPAGESFRGPTVRLTEAAMRVLPRDLSRGEVARAAELMEGAGEPAAAATLWLGLVNMDFRRGDVNTAREHAGRSLRAARTEAALVSLVVLARTDPGLEARWTGELGTLAPGHELVVAARCRDAVRTFTVDPPEVCGAADWVGELARHGRSEETRLAREIAELPARAAREIAAHEARVEELSADQLDLALSHRELDRELRGLGWRAAGEAMTDILLPLPKEDDSFETYAPREIVCRLPVIAWICAAEAVGEALKRKDSRKAEIEERMSNLEELHGLNARLIGYSRDEIDHWRSGKPLELLREERAALVAQFQAGIAEEGRRRYPEPGMPFAAAVDAVLAGPDAGRHGS